MDDSHFFDPLTLAPQRCAVCSSPTQLQYCSGCHVVSYCGAAHQKAHWSQHKAACIAIKRTQKTLDEEEATLRAHPGEPFTVPANVFTTGVGRFWGYLGTRDYMRARFFAADALLKVDTVRAVERALDHFNDMLRLCRSDNLGVRDIIPTLLLRLGREQQCYDFLKWWADGDGQNENYDFGDVTLPYLNIHGANAFESVDIFCSKHLSLSHLVSITLLKLRLRLDLTPYETYENEFGDSDPFSEFERPIGSLVRKKMRIEGSQNVFAIVEALEDQYRKLSLVVHEENPYFWDALVDDGQDISSPPSSYSPGSLEEVALVLYQCKRAWEESYDAIDMIGYETAGLTRQYNGPAVVVGAGDTRSKNPVITAEAVEMRRATGSTIPSKFKVSPLTASPSELYPATIVGPNGVVRFVHRNNPKQALVYVDGACANNGQPNPRAGWAIVCGAAAVGGVSSPYVISGRLENKGPFGDESMATSNRAELRAAIAVLRLGGWRNEGFNSIVIATDSSYVVEGATTWVKSWLQNGWTTRTGGDVKNKDLWDLLLGEVERWKDRGLRVDLWKIPRDLNTDADFAAKLACNDAAVAEYRDTVTQSSQNTTDRIDSGQRRVLTLCFDYESLFDSVFGNLVSSIASKAKVARATNPNDALDMLNKKPPPSVILLADAALTRHLKVWERVIDRLREGATVVLAGCFSSMVNEGQFNRFFAKLNLGWERGSYYRTTVRLCRGAVDSHLTNGLPVAYSQKGLFVKNVKRSAMWYTTDDLSEAAVIFARVGKGRLGYIGDVNGEEASDKVVLAMCGL